MSEFADHLRSELADLAARATPSADGWDRILERLETVDFEVGLDMDNSMGPNRRSRYFAVAAAAVVALVGAAMIGLVRSGDSTEEPIGVDLAESTTTTTAPIPSTLPPPQDISGSELGAAIETGPELVGVYRTDAFGTPVQFESPGRFRVTAHGPGELELTAVGSPVDESVTIWRISGFYSAAQSDDPQVGMTPAFGVDAVDAWLADSHFEVTNDAEALVGPRRARVLDLTMKRGTPRIPEACDAPAPDACRITAAMADTVRGRYEEAFGRPVSIRLWSTEAARLWVVPMEGDEALFVLARSTLGNSLTPQLSDDLNGLMESFRFGQPAPLVLPLAEEQAVADALPVDDARQLAQQLAEGLAAGDYGRMAAALGGQAIWVGRSGEELRTEAEMVEAYGSRQNLYNITTIGEPLPVANGYAFPAGHLVGTGAGAPVSIYVVVGQDGVVRTAEYRGWALRHDLFDGSPASEE